MADLNLLNILVYMISTVGLVFTMVLSEGINSCVLVTAMWLVLMMVLSVGINSCVLMMASIAACS